MRFHQCVVAAMALVAVAAWQTQCGSAADPSPKAANPGPAGGNSAAGKSSATVSPSTAPTAPGESTLRVGLRRSSYGLPARNADHAWWIARTKALAGRFVGAQPTVIEIISTYQKDGSTDMEFPLPMNYRGSTARMTFGKGKIDHEAALTAYDRAGVSAILQLEPGDADVSACLEAAFLAFSMHPSVIGFGIDVEWYLQKQSADKAGQAVSDEVAARWLAKVRQLGDFTLFLKHWQTAKMPPTYRDAHLWFLSDSQQFAGLNEMLADFGPWGRRFKPYPVGYQVGYPKDRRWWSKLGDPLSAIGQAIVRDIPNCRYYFWVDFTAGDIPASQSGASQPAQLSPKLWD